MMMLSPLTMSVPEARRLAVLGDLFRVLEREVHVLVEALKRAADDLASLELDEDDLPEALVQYFDCHVDGHLNHRCLASMREWLY